MAGEGCKGVSVLQIYTAHAYYRDVQFRLQDGNKARLVVVADLAAWPAFAARGRTWLSDVCGAQTSTVLVVDIAW